MSVNVSRIRHEIRARLTLLTLRRAQLRFRLRRHLHGSDVAIISQNCVGSRISDLAGNPYRSPTVGLFFDADSFLEFVGDLPRYLTHDLSEDLAAGRRAGYPVGRMGAVTVNFMHYGTFADAEAKWRERAQRVDVDNVALVFTDKDGATDEHITRFAELPDSRKLAFTAKEFPTLECVAAVPAFAGSKEIGDLYTHWTLLEPVLKGPRLDVFR